MLKEYLRIQLLKTNRGIEESGIPYYIGYLIAFLLFCFASYSIFRRIPYPEYVYAMGLMFLLVKANNRDKNLFLTYTLGKKGYRILRITENLLICFPFAIGYIFSAHYWSALVSILVSVILGGINIQLNSSKPLPTPFSSQSFEFIVGFRKNIVLIIAIYSIASYPHLIRSWTIHLSQIHAELKQIIAMINIEGLHKAYGNQNILNKVFKQFDVGKVHGIVGNNGSGKSTFFKCLIGLERYDGIINSPWPDLKNRIGYLPSEPFMFKKITGREYLRFICLSRKLNPIDFDRRNIFDLPLNAYAAEYSTGMRKKLALMAILLQKNQLLYILDEPFNGVDLESKILITAIINHLSSLGKTVLLSSHIFSTLSSTCHQIHELKDGNFIGTYEKNEFTNFNTAMENKVLSHKIGLLDLLE